MDLLPSPLPFLAVLHLRFCYQTKPTLPHTTPVTRMSSVKEEEFVFKEGEGGGERLSDPTSTSLPCSFRIFERQK